MYHSIKIREQIIKEKEDGKTLVQISEELSISYSTVQRIWGLYKKGGKENLQFRYSNCGLKRPKFYRIYRLSIWLKRKHPTWGAPYIYTILSERYPNEKRPTNRTLQKWFRKKGLSKPRIIRKEEPVEKVKSVHDCWQIDAKENLNLKDETKACYLSIVDVKSGGFLNAPVFSLREDKSSTTSGCSESFDSNI